MKKVLILTLALFLVSTLAYAATYEMVDPNADKTFDAQITITDQVQTVKSINRIDDEIDNIDRMISECQSQISALQAEKAALQAERAAIISQFKLNAVIGEIEP